MQDFSSSNEWDNRGSSPNWHSGLKTLPKHRFSAARGIPREYPEGRWDLDNEKVLSKQHQRSRSAPHSRVRREELGLEDHWAGGQKVLHNRKAVPRSDRIAEITNRADHGKVTDWHYTATMQKTLEADAPKPSQESWLTESYKVLPADEAHIRNAHQRHSPHRQSSPRRLLETETLPTAEWSAGQKVVPANRRRKFFMNNQSDMSFRAQNVQKPTHLPSDATWHSENFKTLEPTERPLRIQAPRRIHDDWEGGFKTLPEEGGLARDRQFCKVEHPYTWLEENGKVLPHEQSRIANVYRFNVENTGWDSAHFKTFGLEEAAPSTYGPKAPGRTNYAANHDWYVAGKVIPHSEQHPSQPRQYVTAGTGWDSGLKTLPPGYNSLGARRGPLLPRSAKANHWDLENRKTLGWAMERTDNHTQEGNRHILRPRHQDMAQFHQRQCRQENTYTWAY